MQHYTSVRRHSPFAEIPFHLLIAGQLSGNLPGVPSTESNTGLSDIKPTHYQLSYSVSDGVR
jgi:hypothetical protein